MNEIEHINLSSRIDWHDGMPITARTFTCMDNLYHRSGALSNSLRAGNNCGLLPHTPFAAHAVFVKRRLEIERLQLIALMPSGNVMHIDEKVDIEVPMLFGSTYYLTCEEADGTVSFNDGEVPFLRPSHSFSFCTLEEVVSREAFPVIKFNVDHGECSIDNDYIPPVLVATDNEKIMAWRQTLAEKAASMAKHVNMPSGEATLAIERFGYILATPHKRLTTEQLTYTIENMLAAVDYYVLAPHADSEPEPLIATPLDIGAWMTSVKERMDEALTVLDNNPVEEPHIDLEELRKELYEQLRGELYDNIYKQLKSELGDVLRNEIGKELLEKLTDIINTRLKKDLHSVLSGELADTLFKKLYDSLYKGLYDALYVPPEEENFFTPSI